MSAALLGAIGFAIVGYAFDDGAVRFLYTVGASAVYGFCLGITDV